MHPQWCMSCAFSRCTVKLTNETKWSLAKGKNVSITVTIFYGCTVWNYWKNLLTCISHSLLICFLEKPADDILGVLFNSHSLSFHIATSMHLLFFWTYSKYIITSVIKSYHNYFLIVSPFEIDFITIRWAYRMEIDVRGRI